MSRCFVVDYRDLRDVRVNEFSSAEEARANCPSEGGASVVSSEEALRAFEGPTLVAVYNRIRRHPNVVRKFESKEVGVRRVWMLLEAYDAAPTRPAPPKSPTEGFTEVDVTKPKSKKSKKSNGVAKRSRIDGDAKITVLVSENPKKKGSASHGRFELYSNGIKVSTALERGVTRADVSWDVRHGFISLS